MKSINTRIYEDADQMLNELVAVYPMGATKTSLLSYAVRMLHKKVFSTPNPDVEITQKADGVPEVVND